MTESSPERWCFEKKLRRFSVSEGIPVTPRSQFKFKGAKMTKLEILKAEKEANYSLIQEDFAEIEVELKKTKVDKDKIQLIHASLVNSISTFLIVHEKYREQLLKEGNTSEFELEKRLEKTLNRKKLEIDMKCHRYLSRSPSTSGGGGSGSGADSMRMKLPKRELTKFDGDVRKWQAYWSSFEEVHLDPGLSDIEKFNYLVQTQVKDSPSATHIASFHFQADMYLKAVNSLRERYGRPKMLIKVYVRDLLKLVIDKSQNKAGNFEELVTKLTHQIRNLEVLGVTTDKCEDILYPVVESCLPDDVYEAWQRCSHYTEKIDDLLHFLQQEVNNRVERDLAQSQFASKKEDTASSSSSKAKGTKDKQKTASTLLVGEQKKGKKEKPLCVFCDKSHGGLVCFAGLNLDLATRQEIVKNKGLCIQCLRKGHTVAKCPGKVKCPSCKESHHAMMCPGIIPLPTREETAAALKAEEEAEVLKAFAKAGASKGGAVKTLVNQARSPDVPLQILNVLSHGTNGDTYRVRLIVDPGSQRTYTTTMMTTELKLPQVGEETIINDLFGGKRTEEKTTPIRQLLVTALDGTNPVTFPASQVDTILRETEPTPRGSWTEEFLRKGITIDDCDSSSPHIHILIGNDICAKIYTGRIVHLPCGVSAMETLFGWVLSGKIPPTKKTVGAYLVSTLISGDRPISDLWTLDTLGILDSTEKQSREELEKGGLEMFNKTVKIQHDGRYEVELPFYEGLQATLPSNFLIAKKRLQSTTKKLKSDGHLEAYDNVFKQWQKDEMIEKCDVIPSEATQYVELTDLSHYLPHRAVIKLSSATTPIRPVFDASAKGKGRPSLNDCLEKGLNLLELIPAILTRFRMYEVGVVADIKKAFQQIAISPKHRDYLRFLWWEDLECKKLMAYRHTRVVFGVSSSPFLLGATLQHHLKKAPQHLKEAAKILMENMYVDNFVASTCSINAAQRLQQQAQQLLLPAQFDLRGWEIGPGDEEKSVSVLGLKWNLKDDTLSLDLLSALEKINPIVDEPATQRKLLALCHSLFDPLGIISPFVLLGKAILRTCHGLKLGWDKELPTELQKEIKKWTSQIHLLANIKIPRFAHYLPKKSTLHVFGDASSLAATAAVFLRTDDGGAVFINLLICKPRLVPKKGTIPRFELIAALFAARLATVVRDFLQNNEMETHYWSDSTTALAWMKGDGPWGVFVTNRVNEIRLLTDLKYWKHVSGNLNPADFPSRGGSVKKMLENSWWEGPEWLKLSQRHWPSSTPSPNDQEVDEERKKVVVAALVQENPFLKELSRYGQYSRMLRIVALCYRFIRGVRRRIAVESMDLPPAPVAATHPVSRAERLAAEVIIIRLIQQQLVDMKSLERLQPFKDEDKLLRIRTRLTHSDNLDFLCPILLPSDNVLVKMLVIEEHERSSHAGVQFILSSLRERYWIVNGRKTVRKIIQSCPVCKRFTATRVEVPEAPLPSMRTGESIPFAVTGVDMFGPLFLKDGTKTWVCLFTCGNYRTIHLEMTDTLSTDGFFRCFRRFIARRGRPNTMLSDNGLNFTGASRVLRKINWEKVVRRAAVDQIDWQFNPPSASWWGGFFERLIGLVKRLLRRVLGTKLVSYEEMLTLLVEVEEIMNNRPLTTLTEDTEDLVPLTPNFFARNGGLAYLPEVDIRDAGHAKIAVKKVQRLREELRSRFRKEYLGFLRRHPGVPVGQTLKPGDVVLVENEVKKRLDWPLAIIQEAVESRDKRTRIYRVKTAAGEIIRPAQRLFPMEIVE